MRLWYLGLLVATACASSSESASSSNREGAPPGTAARGTPVSSDGDGGAGGPSATPPTPAPEYVETTSMSMAYGGLSRTYLLSVPTNYDASRAYPLVLAFHGNPSTASEMREEAPFDVASKDQAIVAYPQAADGTAWSLYKPLDQNPDMYFVQALITEIASKRSIDKSRVYGFGFSGGGFFVAQTACRLGGVFRAIASHSGGGPNEPENPAAPKHPNDCIQCAGGPVATLVIHGDADTAVVPTSGAYTAACAATTNGCGASPSASDGACQTYACTSAPVTYCPVAGLGHQLWSEGLTRAWDFFQKS